MEYSLAQAWFFPLSVLHVGFFFIGVIAFTQQTPLLSLAAGLIINSLLL